MNADSKSTPTPPEPHDVMEVHGSAAATPALGRSAGWGGGAWLVVLATGMFAWAGSYVSHFSGRFDASEFNELPAPRVAAGAAGPVDPLAEVKARGKKLYEACAACHNDDGTGKPGIAPPLAASDWVNADGPNRLARIVFHGLKGAIKVNATTEFNIPAQSMPPQGDVIGSDENVAAVLTYIRTSFGNKSGPIKPEEVKAVRDAVKGRTDQWTVDELLQIPAGAAAAPLTPDQLKARLKALPPDQLKAILQELAK